MQHIFQTSIPVHLCCCYAYHKPSHYVEVSAMRLSSMHCGSLKCLTFLDITAN